MTLGTSHKENVLIMNLSFSYLFFFLFLFQFSYQNWYFKNWLHYFYNKSNKFNKVGRIIKKIFVDQSVLVPQVKQN